MLLAARGARRRVVALGVAAVVPAVTLSLLLVHQPAIGSRRLYPLLRGPLAVAALVLASAAVVVWAATPGRLGRSSLSGLAWAGVAVLLSVGPLLERTPRGRLFAIDLTSGKLAWAVTRQATSPALVDGDLVVVDGASGALVGLDPATGRERWRRAVTGPAGATATSVATDHRDACEVLSDPGGVTEPGASSTIGGVGDTDDLDGHEVTGRTASGARWKLPLEGERVLTIARSDASVYAYVATRAAAGAPTGAVVHVDAEDGRLRWRSALPAAVSATVAVPALCVGLDSVVVAGGPDIAVLDASDGSLRWSHSVASLGKSRRYVMAGAVQQLIVTDDMVFLVAMPDG